MFDRILFNLFQVVVVLAFAPLASGVLSRLKEMGQSKRGPSIFQPYRDLWKLFHKDEIVSEESLEYSGRVSHHRIFGRGVHYFGGGDA